MKNADAETAVPVEARKTFSLSKAGIFLFLLIGIMIFGIAMVIGFKLVDIEQLASETRDVVFAGLVEAGTLVAHAC